MPFNPPEPTLRALLLNLRATVREHSLAASYPFIHITQITTPNFPAVFARLSRHPLPDNADLTTKVYLDHAAGELHAPPIIEHALYRLLKRLHTAPTLPRKPPGGTDITLFTVSINTTDFSYVTRHSKTIGYLRTPHYYAFDHYRGL